MEKTISDISCIFKSQPLFEAGWYYGKAQPSGAIEFSQKELQWMKLHYKKEINTIDYNIEFQIAWFKQNENYIKQLKSYRKFLSEIQRKVKKALNAGSW